MDTCPCCHRKLLSHISARCNWCGAEITDPEYVQQADKMREEFLIRDRQEQMDELRRTGAGGTNPLGGFLGRYISIQPQAPRMPPGIYTPPPPTVESLTAPPLAEQVPQAPGTKLGATPPKAAEPEQTPEQDETSARFGHLEL